MPRQFMGKNTISINIDGVTVIGLYEKSRCELDVYITGPFHWLTGGSHIPYFARGKFNFEGEYGDSRAKDILAKLYRLGCFLRDHLEDLQAEYIKIKEIQTALGQGVRASDFSHDKAELRCRLRSGEMDPVTYQKLYTTLRKARDASAQEIRQTEDIFFKQFFPMNIPYDTRTQVLEILNTPDLLFYGVADAAI